MFSLTSDLLKSITILQSSDQTRGAWIMFIRELQKIRDEHVSESLHFVPSSDDMNASSRKELLRGIAICLDVLVHAFENPMAILESTEKIVKDVARAKESSAF